MISWKSILRYTVALSTTEAEYMATTDVAKEVVWLKGLVEELGFKQDVVQLQCDSQSAIFLTKNQVFHIRSEHIAVRYYKINEWINFKEICQLKVHTYDNAADMMTKPISTENFKHCLNLLQITSY